MTTAIRHTTGDLLPQSGPMMLLEEITGIGPERLEARVRVSSEGPLGLPGEPGVPALAGLEYMAQAVAAWAGWRELEAGRGVRPGLLLGTRRFDSNCARLTDGQVLAVAIERVLEDREGIGVFDCQVRGEGVSQKARLKAMMPRSIDEFLEMGGYNE